MPNTSVIIRLGSAEPGRIIHTLIFEAQVNVGHMPEDGDADNPWIYAREIENTKVYVVVYTNPGQHLPWGVLGNALEGLQIYFGPRQHGNYSYFEIRQEGSTVALGYTGRDP